MTGITTSRLDLAAIGLSAGCAAHCLALPLAAAFVPFLGVVADAEWVHWTLLALAAPIAVLALRHSHTPWSVRSIAAAGLLAMLLGAIGWPEHDWETLLTVAGGALLASAHLVNASLTHARGGRAKRHVHAGCMLN